MCIIFHSNFISPIFQKIGPFLINICIVSECIYEGQWGNGMVGYVNILLHCGSLLRHRPTFGLLREQTEEAVQ